MYNFFHEKRCDLMKKLLSLVLCITLIFSSIGLFAAEKDVSLEISHNSDKNILEAFTAADYESIDWEISDSLDGTYKKVKSGNTFYAPELSDAEKYVRAVVSSNGIEYKSDIAKIIPVYLVNDEFDSNAENDFASWNLSKLGEDGKAELYENNDESGYLSLTQTGSKVSELTRSFPGTNKTTAIRARFKNEGGKGNIFYIRSGSAAAVNMNVGDTNINATFGNKEGGVKGSVLVNPYKQDVWYDLLLIVNPSGNTTDSSVDIYFGENGNLEIKEKGVALRSPVSLIDNVWFAKFDEGRFCLDYLKVYSSVTAEIIETAEDEKNKPLFSPLNEKKSFPEVTASFNDKGTVVNSTLFSREYFEVTRLKTLMDTADSRQSTGGRSYIYPALCNLYLGKDINKANKLLNDPKITGIKTYSDFEAAPFSMYWCMPAYIKTYIMYNSENGTENREVLTSETEENMKRIIWTFIECYYENVFTDDNNPLRITNSENHDALQKSSLYLGALALSKTEDYGGKILPDGKSLSEFIKGAEDFFIKYIDERSKIGLFVEGSENYRAITLEALYNIYDLSDNEILKNKTKMFLDICWTEYAVESINGVRSGAKTRVYNREGDADKGLLWTSSLGSMYFGLNGDEGLSTLPTFMVSDYRPPQTAKEIALKENKGSFEFIKSIPGKGTTEVVPLNNINMPVYTLDKEGDVYTYSYVTPYYAASTIYQDGNGGLTLLSSQNRWQGVTLKSDPDARIYPYIDTETSLHNHIVSMQKGPVMIFKKNTSGVFDMGIHIYPDSVLSGEDVKTEDGWLFGEINDVYYGIKAISGTFVVKNGKLLLTESESPVIIHLGSKEENESFYSFKEDIIKNALSYDGKTVSYTDKKWGNMAFNTESGERTVNGIAVGGKAENIMQSPYINSIKNSGIFTIDFNGKCIVYDFNNVTIKEE